MSAHPKSARWILPHILATIYDYYLHTYRALVGLLSFFTLHSSGLFNYGVRTDDVSNDVMSNIFPRIFFQIPAGWAVVVCATL
jgi:hypothetical protein